MLPTTFYGNWKQPLINRAVKITQLPFFYMMKVVFPITNITKKGGKFPFRHCAGANLRLLGCTGACQLRHSVRFFLGVGGMCCGVEITT